MRDISKYTPNAQKLIRLGWAAWEAGEREDEDEYERILDERDKFLDENFTLEDYDSMIEESSDYPPSCIRWKRLKAENLAKHQKININNIEKETIKLSNKQLRKAI